MLGTALAYGAMNGRPRPVGTLIGILAGYFISEGIYQMMLIGSCSTPAGPGEVECPPEAIRYFFYIFFGIIGGMVGIFAGGSWLSFACIFGGVGVGALRAGLADGAAEAGRGWFVWFGLTFLATPALMLVSVPFVGWKRMQAARLLSEGTPGVGTVLSIDDTGVTINNNPRVRIAMRIEPNDGATPPFEATKTATVSRVNMPRVGDRYEVWFDPDDRSKWMFVHGPGTAAAHGQPGLRRLVDMAREGSRPVVPAPQPHAVVGELSRLNELRLTGKISAEEFASKTAELLRAAPPA